MGTEEIGKGTDEIGKGTDEKKKAARGMEETRAA